MSFYLSVFHPENNIILLLKYTRVEFIYINLPLESHQKIGKTQNILVFEKVSPLVARALVAVRKKKKLVKVKPQH